MILDTNAVSAIVENDAAIQKVLRGAESLQLPVIVVAEYLFGLLGSRRSAELRAGFDRLLSTTDSLLIDLNTAHQYATIKHDLKRRGRPIPENDLWIAALAQQHNLPIASRDAHFDGIESVTRVNW